MSGRVNRVMPTPLRISARVGIYSRQDGRLREVDPVTTILKRRGRYLITSHGYVLDPDTGVFFGGAFIAGPCPEYFDLAEISAPGSSDL